MKKVVSPYPISFACAFQVVELLYLPPRQRPHYVFFFPIKCQKQYLTCEKLAKIHLFVHIMRRKTLFQVLGSPSEQEGAGAEFNEIWKNDFWEYWSVSETK